MGIVERISQIQAEATAKRLAEEQEVQRSLQEAEDLKLQAQALTAKHDAERREVIIAELSPLLVAAGAQEQLEEVRDRVWKIGEVDPEPTPILSDNEDFKKLALRLKASYNTVRSSSGEGEGSQSYPIRDAISISLEVVNHGVNGEPGVWVKSELSEMYNFNNSRNSEFGAISVDEPTKAYSTLEEMLARACIKLGSVQDFWNDQERQFKQSRFGEEPIKTITPTRKPGLLERIFGTRNKGTGRSGNPPFYGGPAGHG